MSIGENIKRLREQYGLSQTELGKIAGVSDKAVSTWETGQKTPRMGAIQRIADHFGLKKSDIIEDAASGMPANLEPYHPRAQMPILGRVAAGLPLYAEDNIIGYCANDFTDGEDYYALIVHGDSMTAAGIDDGDLVVVRRQSCVDEGQIAVVLVNGDDATVKYIRCQDNMVVLIPRSYNPVHQPQFYNVQDTPVSVIGRVVQIRKSV